MSSTTVPVEQLKRQDTWTGQTGFLPAAIGSAIGLDNIWRLPGVAYTNGGDTFLIPYLVAILFVGISMLWLDYALGHKFHGSSAWALCRIKAGGEFIGWFQVFASFVILTYYAAVTAWGVQYMIFSVKQSWGDDPSAFFTSDFLQVVVGDTFSWSPVAVVVIPLALTRIFVPLILGRSLSKGVEATNKIFLPLPVALFPITVIHALFPPGVAEDLDAFSIPQWGELSDPYAWLNAFSQVFYSLSVGFGIMFTYASYLKPKTNFTGTTLVAGFVSSSFEILADIGVFSTLGFMASTQGVGVSDIEDLSGPILSFVIFSQIVSMMSGGSLFGALFPASLVLAGVASLLSLLQVVFGGLQDKFGLSSVKVATAFGIPAGIVSASLFGTRSGLNNLNIVDTFISNIGVVASAVMMAILAATFAPRLKGLREYLNTVSTVKVPEAWEILVGIVVPAVLIFMLFSVIVSYVMDGYGDYDQTFVWISGWGVVGFVILGSIIMTLLPWEHGPISPEALAQIIDENEAHLALSEGEA